jgi:hypothetical protein
MVEFSSGVATPSTASYAPPAVDFSWLANLPNQFYKGKQNAFDDQQNQLKTQIQQAFTKEGLPKDAQGNIDWAQVAQIFAQKGAVDTIPQMAPLVRQQQLDKLAATPDDLMPPPFGGPQPQGAPQQQPPSQPNKTPATVSGGDQPGSTVELVTTQIPQEQAGPTIARIAAKLGVDPDATLTGTRAVWFPTGITGLRGCVRLGSIGPSAACFVITILSAPREMSVPALSAFNGMSTSSSSQKVRIKLIRRHAADVCPPFVCSKREIRFVGPILSRRSTNRSMQS